MVSAELAAPFRCPNVHAARLGAISRLARCTAHVYGRIAPYRYEGELARRRGSRDAHPVRVGLYPHADMNKLTHDIGGHEQDGLAVGLAGSPPLAPELTRPVPGRRFVRNSMTLAPTWLYEVIDLAAMLLKHRV